LAIVRCLVPFPPIETLPGDVVDALRRGRKLEAIRRLRETRSIGLNEAKDAVDAWLRVQPGVPAAHTRSLANASSSILVTLLVLAGMVWALVNAVEPAGSAIVLLNRNGYQASTFTVGQLRHTDDNDGLFWGFDGRVPEGPARLYAPELADAGTLGFRGLSERFPVGTEIPVWYNPAVTDTLFQARSLRVIVRTDDFAAAPELARITWWFTYCFTPLVAVLLFVWWRSRARVHARP
jgi:hypothetical protein